MYYEEQMVNGILCRRSTPNGEWVPLTLQELSERVVKAHKLINKYVEDRFAI